MDENLSAKNIIQFALYEEIVTCKREPEPRERDETETFPYFTETQTRPVRWENTSRDRDVETETTSLMIQWQVVNDCQFVVDLLYNK